MAHQDQGRKSTPPCHAHDLQQALRWLLPVGLANHLGLRSNCTWTGPMLAWAALLWAWSDEKTLTERFFAARKIIRNLFAEQPEPAESYQAFLKLLRKWTGPLRQLLETTFRQRMQETLGNVWRTERWLIFACDGSRLQVPRTRANEARYSPKSKLSREAQKRARRKSRRHARRQTANQARARKANIPRLWLTVLWHVGSGLPWAWQTGPSDSSEREHFQAMLPTLPEPALLVADAGFVGYQLWQTILHTEHQLLVRVGGNVRLLKKLGYARQPSDLVYLWPDAMAKRRLPPLVLRLIVIEAGRHPVYLVTSVLKSTELSDAQAAEIYRRRWGIELFYRHCKQTFERAKLRSHNPDNAMVELEWSLLGIWGMGLYAQQQLLPQQVPPERISFAGVLRAFRRPMRDYRCLPEPGERLRQLLRRALIDDYPRINKASRDYPRKKQETAAGPPRIEQATRAQVQLAQDITQQQKRRLTA